MQAQSPLREVTPAEAKQHLDRGDALLIDVREPEEVAKAKIEGAQLYPMSQANGWFSTDELPKDKPLIIFCHHGSRSAQVAAGLVQRGYTSVANMTGGIDAWSQTVDANVPRY